MCRQGEKWPWPLSLLSEFWVVQQQPTTSFGLLSTNSNWLETSDVSAL